MRNVWIVVGGNFVLKSREPQVWRVPLLWRDPSLPRNTVQPSRPCITARARQPAGSSSIHRGYEVNQRVHVRVKHLDFIEKGIHDLDAGGIT